MLQTQAWYDCESDEKLHFLHCRWLPFQLTYNGSYYHSLRKILAGLSLVLKIDATDNFPGQYGPPANFGDSFRTRRRPFGERMSRLAPRFRWIPSSSLGRLHLYSRDCRQCDEIYRVIRSWWRNHWAVKRPLVLRAAFDLEFPLVTQNNLLPRTKLDYAPGYLILCRFACLCIRKSLWQWARERTTLYCFNSNFLHLVGY